MREAPSPPDQGRTPADSVVQISALVINSTTMDSHLANQMVVIDLVDEPLPEGCSHSMAVRIWTPPGTPVADVPMAAQVLALGFLERATRALRDQVLEVASPARP